MARNASSAPKVVTPGLRGTKITENLDMQIGESFGAHDTGKAADRPGALLSLSAGLQHETMALAHRFEADYGDITTKYTSELMRLARKYGIQATQEAALRAIEENPKQPKIGFTQDMKNLWRWCIAGAGIGA